MKKKIIVIVSLLAIVAASVFVLTYNKGANIDVNVNNTTTDDVVPSADFEPPEPVHVDVEAWEKDVNGSAKVVTIIGLTTCPHCQSYKPVVTKLSQEYGFKLYFFERDAMYHEEFDKIAEKLGIEGEFNYYPTTFITESGNVVISQPGYPGELVIADFYRQYGLIK